MVTTYNRTLNKKIGEQSITDDSNNVTKNWVQEITEARNILELTERKMNEIYKESKQQDTANRMTFPKQIAHQLTRGALGMLKELDTNLKRIWILFDILMALDSRSFDWRDQRNAN